VSRRVQPVRRARSRTAARYRSQVGGCYRRVGWAGREGNRESECPVWHYIVHRVASRVAGYENRAAERFPDSAELLHKEKGSKIIVGSKGPGREILEVAIGIIGDIHHGGLKPYGRGAGLPADHQLRRQRGQRTACLESFDLLVVVYVVRSRNCFRCERSWSFGQVRLIADCRN
jgi:hypothetical protein